MRWLSAVSCMCCAVLCVVLCCVVLCCVVLCCVVLYCVVLCCIVLCCVWSYLICYLLLLCCVCIAPHLSHLLCTDTGAVYAWGTSQHGRLGLGSTTPNPTSISGAQLALDAESHVLNTPQLITGLARTGVCTAICCGYYHSMAVCEGRLYCWGVNTHGM
jgi:hypothetical protein